MSLQHVDVLIVGAGLSGIGAGHHLEANCPEKTYAIFEARGSIGGTWDLFRYPGIRSDSDMYTLRVHERLLDAQVRPDQFPKQGSRVPWRLHQNYARDIPHASLRRDRGWRDGVLRRLNRVTSSG